jgi:hypothetical protein
VSASLQANYYGASVSEPAGTDATTGIRFNREDTQMGTAGAIPIPQSGAHTYFSYYKQVALAVTVTDPVTQISNRTVKIATNVSLPTGVFLYFLGGAGYRQATGSSAPQDAAANQATPLDPSGDGTYAVMTLVAQPYDPAPVPSANSGRNGSFVRLVFAVDSRYTGGAGMLTLPNIIVGYDEG